MAEEKEIELKTEDVNELLTSVPKWIIRWGVTMIFSIMVAALALSYFIKYPDTQIRPNTPITKHHQSKPNPTNQKLHTRPLPQKIPNSFLNPSLTFQNFHNKQSKKQS